MIRALNEVMPQDAEPRVSAVYEDIQRTLRVPFVNQVFRLLANDPHYLESAWRYVAPVARSQELERAARGLRAEGSMEDLPQTDQAGWAALGDLERVRRLRIPFSTCYRSSAGHKPARPGKPVGACELDGERHHSAGRRQRGREDRDDRPERRLRAGSAALRGHTRPPRPPHGCDLFSILGQWPELLEAIWKELRPILGQAVYQERSAALVDRAAQMASGLRPQGVPPAADATSAAVLRVSGAGSSRIC